MHRIIDTKLLLILNDTILAMNLQIIYMTLWQPIPDYRLREPTLVNVNCKSLFNLFRSLIYFCNTQPRYNSLLDIINDIFVTGNTSFNENTVITFSRLKFIVIEGQYNAHEIFRSHSNDI